MTQKIASMQKVYEILDKKGYTVLACFLRQLHQETYDSAVRMYDKLMILDMFVGVVEYPDLHFVNAINAI